MQQSENTAGVEQAEEQPSGIQNLRELLQEGALDSGESTPETGGSHDVPVKFNDLAEKAGMELDDLYKLEVAQSHDGTPITVEAMKDFYAEQDNLQLQHIEREEHRTRQEAALMQAQAELREIMAAMPKDSIKPEVLEKVRARQSAQVELERQRTLDVIPEWTDEAVRTREIEGIAKHLQQFGFPADYLANVVDHRQMKFMREAWLREVRIRQALERVKPGKPNPTKKARPADKAPRKNALTNVNRGNHPDKLHALFSGLE